MIETMESNPVGQHLYPSCGFEEVARQVHDAMKLCSLLLPRSGRVRGDSGEASGQD
jgi:hypothetical protein